MASKITSMSVLSPSSQSVGAYVVSVDEASAEASVCSGEMWPGRNSAVQRLQRGEQGWGGGPSRNATELDGAV